MCSPYCSVHGGDILPPLRLSMVFILGATSPGPSLAVVLRNTFDGGRKQGVACAVGHGLGFGIYDGSSLRIDLETSEQLYNILQIIGGILLVWFGYEIWRLQ